MTEPKPQTATKAHAAGAASGLAGAVTTLSLFLIGPHVGLIVPSVAEATSAWVMIGATLVGGAITGVTGWVGTYFAPRNVPKKE